MAVQAQYPSNVLFLNRGGQEEHEFSLQQQTEGGGVFLDQSHMLFNNGSSDNNNNIDNNTNNSNPRKRGREVPGSAITAPINHSFSLQTQPTQLIDLSQLHQPNVVSTGLRLSFDEQQQYHQNLQQNQNQSYQQQQQQQHAQQQNHPVSNSSAVLALVRDDLATQIKRQREELNKFLQAQSEEYRGKLAYKWRRHHQTILEAVEVSVRRRLRAKDWEVEKASRQNAELEARAAQLSVEAQVWQAKAKAEEATAASLQVQIRNAFMSRGCPGWGTGAAVTQDSRRGEEGLNCTGGEDGQPEDAESAYVDPERVAASGPACKACRTRVASVVLLPCRHLCLCTVCDRVAQACPLCLAVRNSSIEVFRS